MSLISFNSNPRSGICKGCGKQTPRFESSRRLAIWCSAECRRKYSHGTKTIEQRRIDQARYHAKHREKIAATAFAKRQTAEGRAIHRLKKAQRRQRVKNHTGNRLTTPWLRALLGLDSCAYCLAPLRNGTRSLEHVTPLARGGLHDEDNVVLACMPCNMAKGAKTLLEFTAPDVFA